MTGYLVSVDVIPPLPATMLEKSGKCNRLFHLEVPHYHKSTARFIGDMVYGILAQKDVKLSLVVGALKEDISPKKVEDRLSRMLPAKCLEASLHDDTITAEGARKVRRNTLIIIDPSDVQKLH